MTLDSPAMRESGIRQLRGFAWDVEGIYVIAVAAHFNTWNSRSTMSGLHPVSHEIDPLYGRCRALRGCEHRKRIAGMGALQPGLQPACENNRRATIPRQNNH